MGKEQFYDDLKKIYDYISARNKRMGGYYKAATAKEVSGEQQFLDDFLNKISLEANSEHRMAAVTRLADLREDSLTQAIKAVGLDEGVVEKAKELGFAWVSDFYMKEHEALLAFIEKEKLLTPFYRKVLQGVHKTGKAFSRMHLSWNAHIINGVNKELYEMLDGDEEKIFSMLRSQELMDRGHGGGEADRSYSALVKAGETYEAKAYVEVFPEEVKEVVHALKALCVELEGETDEVFGQKEAYLGYLNAIIEAMSEKDRHNLVTRWAEVDRCWMKVTTPIQIGHPLEYYEDHYRKAVAMEWDVRMVNPEYGESSTVSTKIARMFETLFDRVPGAPEAVKPRVLNNIGRVQLYIGQPMFFYGSEFCGLFSAQVVPNDEIVTKEAGKKIFAFSDRVLDSVRNRPKMKIDREVFPAEFLAKEHALVYEKSDVWHKVYEITTIGHEYGHVLWLDNDTESVMNAGGNYKNIEEFKATAGGLVSFFMDDEEEALYWEDVLVDTVKRAVKLVAWMEVAEVLPYYCEGLIHLSGMFTSGVLAFENGKLKVDISRQAYDRLKAWYLETYSELGAHYLKKADASAFLFRYAKKEGGKFRPVDSQIAAFTAYYYDLYQKIGRVVDDA